MPPNPRDNLRPGQLVPLDRVRNVVADATAPMFPGKPHFRDQLAQLVVARLERYRLLAADVERSPAIPPYATGAEQKSMVDLGWLPPHRVERLREYAAHLRLAGALDEAGIIADILDGGDPYYPCANDTDGDGNCPACAPRVAATRPACGVGQQPDDPDPIPQLGYRRYLLCCCKEGQGHKSAEYRAWEARQR